MKFWMAQIALGVVGIETKLWKFNSASYKSTVYIEIHTLRFKKHNMEWF